MNDTTTARLLRVANLAAKATELRERAQAQIAALPFAPVASPDRLAVAAARQARRALCQGQIARLAFA